MIYAVAADAVLVIHALFIVWVGLGAGAVLRWPRLALLHLPALLWGIHVSFSGRLCPLTPFEQWLRALAGQRGYSGGFIDHYLMAAIYPDGLTPAVQIAIGVGLVLLNIVIYARVIHRWRQSTG